MKQHRYQWLIGGIILLITFVVGGVFWYTQRPATTSRVSKNAVQTHYETWKHTYLRGNSREKFVQTNNTGKRTQTLSEAQGYGMLIAIMAAQQGLDRRQTFDQLTRYYLAHRISTNNPLMAWRQQRYHGEMASTTAEKSSATDGDLDIAYALVLADEKWGNDGPVKYGDHARELIRAIHDREIDPVTQLPRVGNWAVDQKSARLLRPSDLITAYFRKFARYTQDGSWTQVAQNSQTVLKRLSARHATGLIADFVTVSGPELKLGSVRPKQVESRHDNHYSFNACRIPWRVAYDYQLNRSEVSYDVVAKILKFFKQPGRTGTVYSLTGHPVEDYRNDDEFMTPIAYAAYAIGDTQMSDRYAPELLKKCADTRNYYPETLHMVTLLTSGSIGKRR